MSLPDVIGLKPILAWFRRKRWKPFAYQLEAWRAYRDGASGLIHAPTGMGKSYAAWLGAVSLSAANPDAAQLCAQPLVDPGARPEPDAWTLLARRTGLPRRWLQPPQPKASRVAKPRNASVKALPLRVLWITPLRALAGDTAKSLLAPIQDLSLPWTVQVRTGDTSAYWRKKQREHLPTALVTTPESLSLLLSYPQTRQQMADLQCVVVDEWHELMGTKRGVQVELALARLRRWQPGLRTWGLSATLGNLPQAMDVLLGWGPQRSAGVLVQGPARKKVRIDTVCPAQVERFPWAGHLGLKLLPQVLEELDQARSALVFTNTRSQSEMWFQAILNQRPQWLGQVALHHGSLDRDLRSDVEDLLRAGAVRCVVCTSSLDLGVDFAPVDLVVQVGSPRGVGRLLQRAGRSGHQPGAVSRVVCVPTHALELVEFSALRLAAGQKSIESRVPLDSPLDLLAQHLVTIALGGGFDDAAMCEEVRSTHAFRDLTQQQWAWTMDFVTRGGPSLRAYEQFSKVVPVDGRHVVTSPDVAKLHRMSIGTITSEASVTVRLHKGGVLGTLEESFISRLHPGDRFFFAGRALELVSVYNMTAFVRKAPHGSGPIPRWMGGRLSLSSELANALRQRLAEARAGRWADAEMRAARPLLELQAQWSCLPGMAELLIESMDAEEGSHFFVFPFAGRMVHEGLAAVVAYRLSRQAPRSLTVAYNDYGLEIVCASPLQISQSQWRDLLSPDHLLEDILGSLNATELARRQFRQIARVAGLIFPGFPGAAKSARHLQASSDLFFDVFAQFDPGNLLLEQANREVLQQQLEFDRLRQLLDAIGQMKLKLVQTSWLTPLAFPLWAEEVAAQVSSEKWGDRIRRMVQRLEAFDAAG